MSFFGWSDFEEEGSWDVEDMAGGGTVDTAGLELAREDVVEAEAEEDVDRTGDGEEIEDGQLAAWEECRGVTVEGDEDEEDFEIGDLGEEEELELEDVVLLSE